jgi:hypothetical protein
MSIVELYQKLHVHRIVSVSNFFLSQAIPDWPNLHR